VDGDRVGIRVNSDGSGTVVGIIRRNWRALVGAIVLDKAPSEDSDDGVLVRFAPVDTRFPNVKMVTRQVEFILNQVCYSVCRETCDFNSFSFLNGV